jgi:hypothetical protein
VASEGKSFVVDFERQVNFSSVLFSDSSATRASLETFHENWIIQLDGKVLCEITKILRSLLFICYLRAMCGWDEGQYTENHLHLKGRERERESEFDHMHN